MKALYSIQLRNEFSCRIPKTKSIGYLKSCFGYGGRNEHSIKFTNITEDAFGTPKDYCDIDGYLAIPIKDKSEVEKLKRILQIIFPRISEWKQVSFDEIINPSPEVKERNV